MKWLWCLIVTLTLGGQKQRVTIECDDLLKFKPSTITVAAGSEITLELKNVAKTPSLKHNFVLLKPGTDIAQFGNAAMSTKDDNHIPPAMAAAVLASTRMANPGETVTVTFTLTEPGNYEFVCSYPGHFSLARGTIRVE